MNGKIILASASPRRQELLRLIFDRFEVVPSGVEEALPASLSAEEAPQYLSHLKAEDVAHKFPDCTVIGADTAVLSGGKILGKPKTEQEAYQMLKMLSDSTHNVITGCTVIKNGAVRGFSSKTEVTFYKLSDAEIREYIKSGDPFDKTGSYGIQSGGALFVKEIRGDYYNVVGLPIAPLKRLLEEL